MFLIKILGNSKTSHLNVEIRYKDMVNVMSDVKKMDEILNTIEYINEPITMNLSCLLQLCCQFTLNPDTVKYLLELGGDPNYLDANGGNAYQYVDDNDLASDEVKVAIKELLIKYNNLSTMEVKEEVRKWGWDWMYVAKQEFCRKNGLK